MLEYPRQLLEIVVISDGSTDRTNEIVQSYADRGVQLRVFEGRIGKTACLNRVVPEANGDVIVFSDANALYEKDAVRDLAANFSDPTIGFVTGSTRYAVMPGAGEAATVGLYAALEQFTKKAESRIGSCVGADGAIFAIRKHLYPPLGEADINDLVIPLTIVRRGYRGVLEPAAFCIEPTAGDARGEFRRQVRITSRSLAGALSPRGPVQSRGFGHLRLRAVLPQGGQVPVPLLPDRFLSLQRRRSAGPTRLSRCSCWQQAACAALAGTRSADRRAHAAAKACRCLQHVPRDERRAPGRLVAVPEG